jgi:YbbR domain-containing protein
MIKRFVSENLPWKLVSLALAAIMWIIVINTQNPLQPKEISIPITLLGIEELAEKGFVIQNQQEIQDAKIRVIVRGPRLQVEKLRSNLNLIQAKLDLSTFVGALNEEVESIERMATYSVNVLLDGVTIEDIRPKTTYVTFEKEKIVTKRVGYTITGGTNSNYMALEPVIKPNTVEIKGPKTKVDSIARVLVMINVDDFSEEFLSDELQVMLLNEEGEEINGLTLNPAKVEITLPIGKIKTVPLEPQFTGQLPEGYIQSNTILTPKEITIVGKQDVVESIQTIKLAPISLDGMIQSDTIKADFILPQGIKYLDDIENKAVVTIEVQRENSYQYEVNVTNLNLDMRGLREDFIYEILDDKISLVLAGPAEELLAFRTNELSAAIDLQGYEEGEYSIPITLFVPDSLRIVNTPNVLSVRIVEVLDEEEELELDTEDQEEEDAPNG